MGVAGEQDAADRPIGLLECIEARGDHRTGAIARDECIVRQRCQCTGRRWNVPDAGDDERAPETRLAVIPETDVAMGTPVLVAGDVTCASDVRARRPGRRELTVRGVDQIQQVRQDLVFLELFDRAKEVREVGFQLADLPVRNREHGTVDPGTGNVGSEHPFGHDVGVDLNPLTAGGGITDPEIVVEGIEPRLIARREADESFTSEPQFQLDRLPRPFGRHLGDRPKPDRGVHPWPPIADCQRVVGTVGAGEGPCPDGCDARVSPGPKLREPACLPFETPEIELVEIFQDAAFRRSTRFAVTGCGRPDQNGSQALSWQARKRP